MEILSQEGLFLAFSFCVCMREGYVGDKSEKIIWKGISGRRNPEPNIEFESYGDSGYFCLPEERIRNRLVVVMDRRGR